MDRTEEHAFIDQLIRRIVDECPRRHATSASELRAQNIVREQFESAGLKTHFHTFSFNENIHANLALHFGAALAGTIISPFAPKTAFALHATSSISYWADSTRRGYLLRRLLPFKPSQNLVGVMPAEGEPALRIVFLSHIDAAFTGVMFRPEVVRHFRHKPPRMLRVIARPLALATRANAVLAGIDLLRATFGAFTLPLRPLEYLLTIPSAVAFVLSSEIVMRDEVVPGANDDLSGVASLPLLARRLQAKRPSNVELVFVATGCEEASLGGADALARDMEDVWDKERTVIVAVDTLANGELLYLHPEGEVVESPVPAWLKNVIDGVAASEPRFASVREFQPPVGGTDAAAFLARGWDAISLTAIDPAFGTCRHYHTPDDTPDNLDVDQVLDALDFAEKLTHEIIAARL